MCTRMYLSLKLVANNISCSWSCLSRRTFKSLSSCTLQQAVVLELSRPVLMWNAEWCQPSFFISQFFGRATLALQDKVDPALCSLVYSCTWAQRRSHIVLFAPASSAGEPSPGAPVDGALGVSETRWKAASRCVLCLFDRGLMEVFIEKRFVLQGFQAKQKAISW